MEKTFVYGMFVGGDNFTDRTEETRRLKSDFENGVNVILVSPRRMGKTSLVKRVQEQVDSNKVKVVYMDIYDCRNEYEFYNKFASALLKQTAGKMELAMRYIGELLTRISPKISFAPDATAEYSISLGITPKNYSPEEILTLPETLSKRIGKPIVVCIDEFQQIGQFADSLSVQKRMRGVWQLQQHVSYCLFGSKKHLLTELFQDKRMPFYQFGDTIYLEPISTDDWIPFICSRFEKKGMIISEQHAAEICRIVRNHSSYVQQLSWNVMLNTDKQVTDSTIEAATDDLIRQNSELFMQQTGGLSSYQMNFLRAVTNGVHSDFTSKEVLGNHHLGSKSNVARLISMLIDKELIEMRSDGIYIADPILELWLRKRGV